ncbi:MAG: alpha-L-fucosidase [Planctomycetota bacterium]|nr:alpha-L-fucosidase [Planctomycetota bacterium]
MADQPTGAQRLSVDQLTAWRDLEYGMFIHFGLATFSPKGAPHHNSPDIPISHYQPTALDVDQWVQVARDAGMRYAILTARHGTGFSLWPTKYSERHVGNTRYPSDVVELFVNACRRHGVIPALYINTIDRHNLFGSVVKPSDTRFSTTLTPAYMEHFANTISELLTQYGSILELWIDGPAQMTPADRRLIYNHIANTQPETIIAMNSAFLTEGVSYKIKDGSWPSDLAVIEQSSPPYCTRTGWHTIAPNGGEPEAYFIPTECSFHAFTNCSHWWFGGREQQPYSTAELAGLRLLCRERKANCLFNMSPTPDGVIDQSAVQALTSLAARMDQWDMRPAAASS